MLPVHAPDAALSLSRLVVFLAELLAFAVAFQLLYEFPRQPIDSDSTATTELDYVPRALFTLLKWTLGEVRTYGAYRPRPIECAFATAEKRKELPWLLGTTGCRFAHTEG